MRRLWRGDRVAVGVVVLALVAAGLVASAGASSGAGQAQPSGTGVRFRIVGEALPTANAALFTNTSFVVPNHLAVDLTDVVVQNSHGDSGMLRILVGTEVIFEERLAGLRDQQYAIPLHVNADQPVVVAVNCSTPGMPGKCAPSASFFG